MSNNTDYEIYKKVGNTRQYQLYVKVLGKGQYATTHLAKDVMQNKVIACKVISKDNIMNSLKQIQDMQQATQALNKIMYRLQNEIHNMEQMSHPNIVAFEGLVETQSNFYFFMEYCEGGTLEKLLKLRQKLPLNEALYYFKQLAQGCKYLYDKSVIHRDLKPSNVLLTKDQKVKIADFGFSKELEQNIKDLEFFNTPWIGTPIYMSPQVIGGEYYSIKTDIWSLGIILYEMIYGIPPWYSDQMHLLQEMIRSYDIKFPQDPPIGDQIKDLIRLMLIKQEANRLSIIQVLQILQQIKG